MFLDSKILSPSPPYYVPSSPSFRRASLRSLPPHILLHVIYLTFPRSSFSSSDPDTDPVRARKTLYWLATSLRLVDRTMYAACMHILRSAHIPAYDALVRPPYTSDPFPLLSPHSPSPSYTASPYGPLPAPPQSTTNRDANPGPLSTIQRETAVLDKFLALKVREDVWADESELHLERREAYRDLFDHTQPRARLEDLVRDLGIIIPRPALFPALPHQLRIHAPPPPSEGLQVLPLFIVLFLHLEIEAASPGTTAPNTGAANAKGETEADPDAPHHRVPGPEECRARPAPRAPDGCVDSENEGGAA
ncbi:hypothetical protein DXG01_014262 [Tephrocybe rancida]|nr:hypothetical protein DXG01_014262 [Tephrocybe rancida]